VYTRFSLVPSYLSFLALGSLAIGQVSTPGVRMPSSAEEAKNLVTDVAKEGNTAAG
jgi:hypothetical protein